MSQYITLAPYGGQDWYYKLSIVNETTLHAYLCSQFVSYYKIKNVLYPLIM